MFGFFISELYVPICRCQLKKHCLDNITARRAHVTTATTEHTCFTECMKKSTKAWKTLGRLFAECDTPHQRSFGKLYIGNSFF